MDSNSPESVATRENIGRRFAIAIGRQIITAPTIKEPIEDGEVQIALDGYKSHKELLYEAWGLASLLQMPPMSTSGLIKEFHILSKKTKVDLGVFQDKSTDGVPKR